MTKPLITVLVTAHRRRQYIRKALDSVRAQDIDRSEYEVIVVSNFEGRYEGLSNLRWITVDEEGLSPKIAVGFEEARGEIVSMLEDDDRWLPGKLRLVRDLMRRERADFLHNNIIMTYDDTILPPNEQTDLKVCSFSAKIGPGFNTVSLQLFRRIWPCIWNNSSISIRHDFVLSDQELTRFLKVSNVTHGVDWLLTLYSIDYGTVLHVHNPLTLYNLHNFFEAPYHLPERMLARIVRMSREYLKVLRFLSNKCKTSRCGLIADMLELATAYPYFMLTDSEGLFDPRPRSEFMRYLGERLPAYLLLLLYSPRSFANKTLWSLMPLTLTLKLLLSEL